MTDWLTELQSPTGGLWRNSTPVFNLNTLKVAKQNFVTLLKSLNWITYKFNQLLTNMRRTYGKYICSLVCLSVCQLCRIYYLPRNVWIYLRRPFFCFRFGSFLRSLGGLNNETDLLKWANYSLCKTQLFLRELHLFFPFLLFWQSRWKNIW